MMGYEDSKIGNSPADQSEAGFTLLEVIVAFAILATSLAVLFQTIATATGRASQAEIAAHARLLAQSLLAQVGREVPASPGETIGADGHGLRWRVQQVSYGEPSGQIHGGFPVVEVSAQVSWGEGSSAKSLTISTLRLASQQGAK